MIITSWDGTKLERAVAVCAEAIQMVQTETALTLSKLNMVVPKGMPVEQCKNMGSRKSSIDSYGNDHLYSTTTWQQKVKLARADADKLLARSKAKHEENLEAIENNKHARAAMEQVAETLGWPKSYHTYEYKTSRSRNRTRKDHTAGWVEDMHRWLIINDNWEREQKAYAAFIEKISAYEKAAIQADKEIKRGKEAAAQQLRADRKLAVLIGKYGLNIESDSDDVLQHLLGLNKYLYLAHYMLLNREDWNDGYSLAQAGLSGS